jgi:hypothetical protein
MLNDFLADLLTFQEGLGVGLENVLLCLLTAYFLGQIVGWLYVWTHRGLSYSASVAQSLVLLSLIVALVMIVIGNSLARAFGLFGALALIRFRTPIKDVRDTVFLFFAVAVGIATGTQNLVAAAVGTVVIGFVLAFLFLARFGAKFDQDGLIRFRCPASGEKEARIRGVLGRFCDHYALLHMREVGPGPVMEFAYQVKLFDSGYCARLVDEVGRIDEVSDLSLLMQEEEVQP